MQVCEVANCQVSGGGKQEGARKAYGEQTENSRELTQALFPHPGADAPKQWENGSP